MSARQCYALFVGIDKYQRPVPPLDGCVNDMRAMRDYLQRNMQRNGIPLHLEVLENEEATRFNVVKKFESHLTQAGENDIAFFYFSGHGAQERSHPIFSAIEPDGQNETLVCYDSRQPDGMDLADKEIATLLDLVARRDPHIVVIYDCCNSGSGTRDLGQLEEAEVKIRAFDEIPERTRSLDDYILPRDLNTDRSVFALDNPDQMIVPKPRHIHLSAAQSFELAKETLLGGSPRGVFTYSMIEVLENAVGPLTYTDLMRRVRSLVLERTFDQSPQLYASTPEDANLVFLEGLTTLDTNYYTLTFDRELGWKIDAGAVQGLVGGSFTSGQTLLSVYGEQATTAQMEDPSQALGKVSIREVRPTESLVRLEGTLSLDKKGFYRTKIFTMSVASMPVFFKGAPNSALSALQQAMGQAHEAKLYLSEARREGEADYLVVASRQGQYYVIRQTNADALPLFAPTQDISTQSAEKTIDHLIHIARWERVLDMQNPGSTLFSESMKIELVHPDRDEVLDQGGLGMIFRYRGEQDRPRFRLRMVNTGQRRLFGSLLYLSSQFEINPDAIPQGGMWLEPGQSAWAAEGTAISGGVSSSQSALGRHQVTEVFKLVFSTEEFDGRMMRLPELGQPRPRTRSLEEQSNTRALLFGTGPATDIADWNVNQVSITLIKESV